MGQEAMDMQAVLPAGVMGIASQDAAPIQTAGASGNIQNAEETPETKQGTANTSFISIFLQGKLRCEKAAGEREAKNIPNSTGEESEKEETAEADSDTCDQLARLFAMINPFASGDPQDESGAACADLQALPADMAAGPYVRREIEELPEECGKQDAVQAEVTESGMSTAGKIVEQMKSMGGSYTRQDDFGETLAKEKELPSREISGDFVPSAGTAFTEHTESAEGVALRSASVERALDKFTDDLSRSETGDMELRIVLEPESLGTLMISVSRGEKGISAKIRSDSRETCAAITDQIQQLVQSMEEKGIKVDHVDVAFGQMGEDTGFAQNGGGRGYNGQNFSSSAKGKTDMTDHTGFFDTWNSRDPAAVAKDTAVEYRV
ncbi:MAG: flagellar hook-length control protein FliK [Clostridia bacterium]|nr:flagellar hook-length control protein FliK [Clostridia bacterium]